MRWLVTGASGMLGRDLVELLRGAGEEVTAATRVDLDITDPDAVAAAVPGHDVVVNCAAWTAVDDAEEHEGEAYRVNAVGPALLGRSCRAAGALIVQVSTDYVFDGRGTAADRSPHAAVPYPEDAPVAPRTAYGRTKAAGEWAVRAEAPDAHLVVRTAWLYGAHGPCFPRTIARVAAERGHLDVVDDQVGQPTWTVDVADLILRLVRSGARTGTFHATAGGMCSWFDFARAVVGAHGLDPAVVRATDSTTFARPAPRPSFSALAHDALRARGVAPIGPWLQRWTAAAGVVLAGVPG